MNDTIIVACIGTCGVIAAALINSWRKPQSSGQLTPTTSPVDRPRRNDPPGQEWSVEKLKVEIATVPTPIRIEMAHRQISEAIEAVPPYHQDGIHDSFVGKQVLWQARLRSFTRLHDKVSLVVDLTGEDSYAFCYARLEDCEGLDLAPTGTFVEVVGVIEQLNRWETTLKDCKIKAVPSAT